MLWVTGIPIFMALNRKIQKWAENDFVDPHKALSTDPDYLEYVREAYNAIGVRAALTSIPLSLVGLIFFSNVWPVNLAIIITAYVLGQIYAWYYHSYLRKWGRWSPGEPIQFGLIRKGFDFNRTKELLDVRPLSTSERILSWLERTFDFRSTEVEVIHVDRLMGMHDGDLMHRVLAQLKRSQRTDQPVILVARNWEGESAESVERRLRDRIAAFMPEGYGDAPVYFVVQPAGPLVPSEIVKTVEKKRDWIYTGQKLRLTIFTPTPGEFDWNDAAIEYLITALSGPYSMPVTRRLKAAELAPTQA
jgi:hypothetical protein